MELKIGKDERFSKGTGTAAKAAVKDVEKEEKKKVKEFQKKNEEVILDETSKKEQFKSKRDKEMKSVSISDFIQSDKMVTVTYDKIHILNVSDVRNAMLNSSDLYGYITKQVNPKNFLFGWVKFKDFILPTYDLEVVYDSNSKEYYIYSHKYDDIISLKDLKPITLKHPTYDASVTVDFEIYKYLKFDGVFFVPGTGLKFATDVTNFNLIDMSQLYLRRAEIAGNAIVYFFVPVEETEENQKAIPIITNLTGYRNDISSGVVDLVKFVYEFTPSEVSNFSTVFVKDYIHGKEFMIPHELVTQARTICNAIETNSVTNKQLEKLADILKIRFDVVVSEEIRNKVKFTLPPMNEKNKAVYEMTDMTEEEYNILLNGIELSEGIYGYEDLVSAFKSGNYGIKDVQFILDKFRETATTLK